MRIWCNSSNLQSCDGSRLAQEWLAWSYMGDASETMCQYQHEGNSQTLQWNDIQISEHLASTLARKRLQPYDWSWGFLLSDPLKYQGTIKCQQFWAAMYQQTEKEKGKERLKCKLANQGCSAGCVVILRLSFVRMQGDWEWECSVCSW